MKIFRSSIYFRFFNQMNKQIQHLLIAGTHQTFRMPLHTKNRRCFRLHAFIDTIGRNCALDKSRSNLPHPLMMNRIYSYTSLTGQPSRQSIRLYGNRMRHKFAGLFLGMPNGLSEMLARNILIIFSSEHSINQLMSSTNSKRSEFALKKPYVTLQSPNNPETNPHLEVSDEALHSKTKEKYPLLLLAATLSKRADNPRQQGNIITPME